MKGLKIKQKANDRFKCWSEAGYEIFTSKFIFGRIQLGHVESKLAEHRLTLSTFFVDSFISSREDRLCSKSLRRKVVMKYLTFNDNSIKCRAMDTSIKAFREINCQRWD